MVLKYAELKNRALQIESCRNPKSGLHGLSHGCEKADNCFLYWRLTVTIYCDEVKCRKVGFKSDSRGHWMAARFMHYKVKWDYCVIMLRPQICERGR